MIHNSFYRMFMYVFSSGENYWKVELIIRICLVLRSRMLLCWIWDSQSSDCEAGNNFLLHNDFLMDLFFDPEDGSYLLLRNVRWLSPDYTALYHRRQKSSWMLLFFTLSVGTRIHYRQLTTGAFTSLIKITRVYFKHIPRIHAPIGNSSILTKTLLPKGRLHKVWKYLSSSSKWRTLCFMAWCLAQSNFI
jgi:hypothetical protein